jgi:hypothetical protein
MMQCIMGTVPMMQNIHYSEISTVTDFMR